MKILRIISTIFGVATAWDEAGQILPGLSLEAPATPSANSTCSDWTAWMPPRTDPAVIMQVLTETYVPVEKNFIALMEANSGFSRENIYLMCLDKESVEAVALMGIRCVPLVNYHHEQNADIWKLRIEIMLCLVEAGYNVILSDSDALWLKDPMQDFDLPEVRDCNIVASRGSFPSNLGRVWGSTACMGFILFRPSAGMNVILVKMKQLVLKLGDDQRAINTALKELGVDWNTSTDMRYILSTDFGRGFVPVGDPDEGGLNVTLLPHNRYTRRCDGIPIGPNTTVAHCYAGKTGLAKISWMRKKKLWSADDLN
ncbi:unnamed protein product [Ascophyllum nodosum]